MTWADIWKIILTAVASVGGVSAVVVVAVKFSADFIAARLEEKYTQKLNKELEAYKSLLENKNYISKTRFDAEFQLYRQLTKSFADMVKIVAQLFPQFTKDVRNDYEKYKEQHDRAVDAIVLAQDDLRESGAFISEGIFSALAEIENLCKRQLSDFQDFRLRPDAESYRGECREEYQNAYRRTEEINTKFKSLIVLMREYISNLDTIDN